MVGCSMIGRTAQVDGLSKSYRENSARIHALM